LDNNENNLDAQNVMSTEATYTAYKKKLSGADIKSRDQRRQDFLKPYKAKNSLLWESDRLASVVEHIEERVAKHQQDAEALPEGLERSHYLATHKVLVFCEFLSALDLIKIALDQQGIDSLRYDGTVPMKKRDAAVAQFEEHDKDFEVEGTKADPVMVMLITNKAGNEGINLVHAVDVVIVAPTWNPYVEDLLIGRAARSGQQNTVQVFRFYSWDSIERKVRMTQMDKRATVERVLDDVYLLNFKHIIRRGTEDEFLDMVCRHLLIPQASHTDIWNRLATHAASPPSDGVC
jgi:SNF2 family DNA or RNA helicase